MSRNFKIATTILLAICFVTMAQDSASPVTHNGQTYRTLKMPDGKVWFAENVNYATSKSLCYGNKEVNCQKCGRLYDWETAKGVCPSGWHLPSDAEWSNLAVAVGGSETAGIILKSKSEWSSDGNGIDKYGFSTLPCGYNYGGSFYNYGYGAEFWSSTEEDANNAWNKYMYAGYKSMNGYNGDKAFLRSVRCVKN
jgi:uncharacterized protein (TIGR02145 family)